MSISGLISAHMQELVAGGIFAGVMIAVMAVDQVLSQREQKARIMARLAPRDGEAGEEHKSEKFWKFLEEFGSHFLPSTEKERQTAKLQILYAGYVSPKALERYFGIRALCGFGFSGLFLSFLLYSGKTSMSQLLFTTFFLGIGYYAPYFVLSSQVKARNRRIFRELPDAIDLLVICIDAGLGFEMALFRVSRELQNVAPILSREFERYFLATKGGVSRKDALESLKQRSGEQGLCSVVDVILQSLKFGTDISHALRVHSEAMRKKRQQMAEEKGGKVAVKLTLPLVLLILPVLLIIILGPAVMNLIRHFS